MFDFSLRGGGERVRESKDPFSQDRPDNSGLAIVIDISRGLSDSSLLARLFTILGSGPCAGVSAFPTGWRLGGS